MRIAVTYENGRVFQHFGHTKQFKLYDVNNGKIENACLVDTNGQGHGALADFLKRFDVDLLICGGIGGGAQNALAEANVKLCGGVSGDCDAAVQAYVEGKLNYDPNVKCSHHGDHHHDDAHKCGAHGCGSHKCGEHDA